MQAGISVVCDAPFDPNGWHPHNERSWYRGDAALYFSSANTYTDESTYGNYSIASAAGQSVQVFPGNTTVMSPTNSWYANQHKGLKYSLGFLAGSITYPHMR